MIIAASRGSSTAHLRPYTTVLSYVWKDPCLYSRSSLRERCSVAIKRHSPIFRCVGGTGISPKRAEYPSIILSAASTGLELLCVPAHGIGFAQVSDDSTSFGIVDDRERRFCGLAEAVKRDAQIVSRKKKWGGRRDEILHRLAEVGASGL